MKSNPYIKFKLGDTSDSNYNEVDLHKDFVDDIVLSSKENLPMRREKDIIDVWFESGSMPYAQLHYPFENVERFERGFPADFIAEGLDQTRGWFYTLMVISTCLFDKPAFKNLIVNGLVLAADGKKMAKRLRNYPDPMNVLTKYGADSLRLYMINSPVVRADTLKFTEDGVNDVVRGVFLPWYNAFRFFIQCVENNENITQATFVPNVEISKSSTNDVDVWILASSLGLVKFVHQEMQGYRLYTVVPRLVGFIEELTNWYVRLNRERLKGAMGVQEAVLGLNVLFEVLVIVTQIMSPITPFFSEYLYQHLRKLMPDYKNTDSSVPMDTIGKSNSVHYLMLPTVDESRLDPKAEARFKTLQVAVTLARIARERRHIRSNLPLKNVIVIAANEEDVEALNYLQSYFKSEVNTWNVESTTEWQNLCKLNVIPNFKSLGQRCGKDMKNVSKAINALPVADVVNFMTVGKMTVLGYELTSDDLVVKREFTGDTKQYEAAVSDDGSLMIVIDTTCDEEILAELRARQIAACVQKLRKSSGLVITDKVEIFYEDSQAANGGLIASSLVSHFDLTMKRIKTIPLPMSLRSNYSSTVGSEIINDGEISKNTVNLVLTVQCAAVDHVAVSNTLASSSSEANIDLVTMYVQTMDYERVVSSATLEVVLEDNTRVTLTRDVHYFNSVLEMICKGSKSIRDSYTHLPTSFN
jgi:isoleucyl-tRNA synthetase